MEEFDIDDINDNSDIGTSVAKIKKQDFYIEHKNTETDIDYDNIMNNLNNSDINDTLKINPKINVNINQLVRNIETNIDNYRNHNEPLPVNLTQQMIEHSQQNNVIPKIDTIKINNQSNKNEEQSMISNVYSNFNKHIDVMLYMLFFMLLNNKFIIEFIYNKIPYMTKYNSPYPNLIFRSIIFALLILLLKKYYL